MKTFDRHRNLRELRREVNARGWRLNMKRFNEGSDYVSFKYRHPEIGSTRVLVNTVNGRIIVRIGDEYFNEGSPLDGKPWFDELLGIIYIPKEVDYG